MIFTEVNVQSAQSLLDRVDAGQATTVSPLSGGFANSNFRVDRYNAPPLVLKIWDNRTVDAARILAHHMLHLAEHGVKTPPPIAAKNGDLVTEVDGQAWMLQPFVDGHWLKANERSMGNVGAALAQLHEVPIPEDIPDGFLMGLGLMDFVLEVGHGMDHPFIPRLTDEVRRLRAELPPNLPKGVIHGDLFYDNIIADGDEISAILDFEEIALDDLVLDIAMTFVGCGWVDSRPVRKLWDALLKGYQEVRPLQKDELDALPIYLRYATLGIATWRFHQFNIKRPDVDQQDRYEEMIHRLDGPFGLY